MKDLKAVRGNRLVREMVAQGEHERQDFKFSISDARKIARSVSAFANNGGGRLLIGVKDNGAIAGVRNEEDIFVVEQAAERYCRPSQPVDFKAYLVDGSMVVIVAEIAPAIDKPVYVVERDGSLKAYFRVADENIAAHPLMVRSWELRASSQASSFNLLGNHTAVLDLIARRGRISGSRELAIALHISQHEADEIVAGLASMELVDFVFENGGFVIAHRPCQ